MDAGRHATAQELDAWLDEIRRSPKDGGTLQLIVRRPKVGQRELLHQAELDLIEGLVGDTWRFRASKDMADGSPHPEKQLNIMNVRAVAAVAAEKERWPLAGDQLYVDLDLSERNVPAGTRLEIGDALIEVTPPQHLGCSKFLARFGTDATKWVNSPVGRELRLRGINAKVVRPGAIRVGDAVRRVFVESTPLI